MFDRYSKSWSHFQIGVGVFFKSVGTFFVGGHEALPSTGYIVREGSAEVRRS